MNNLSSRRAVLGRAAFTLIELLVVISIIAVLAGILLPVTASVMENARKTQAKSTEMQIVAAVKNFQTEYGVYPVPQTGTAPPANSTPTDTIYDRGSGTYVGASGQNNNTLFAVLRAIETSTTPSNTRHIVYFEGNDVKNVSMPKGGFIPVAATGIGVGNSKATGGGVTLYQGDLVDPWGNLYYIAIDTDYNDQVANPYPASDSGGSGAIGYTNKPTTADTTAAPTSAAILRFGVICWSPGKDGVMQSGVNPGTSGTSYGDDVLSWQ